jgi:hypothetical protein
VQQFDDEAEEHPPAEMAEGDEALLAASWLEHYTRDEGCVSALIGVATNSGEIPDEPLSPDDARATGWMIICHHPNGSAGIFGDAVWRDRATAEQFRLKHTINWRTAPEAVAVGMLATDSANAIELADWIFSTVFTDPKNDAEIFRKMTGDRAPRVLVEIIELRDRIYHLEQRLPQWRKEPVKFAVHVLKLDPATALELADNINGGFFAACQATDDPFETCKKLTNNSMPAFLHEYFEKAEEIKRLETQITELDAELARLKTNTEKPAPSQSAPAAGLHQSAPKRRARGAHFGGEPDPGTWQKINDLLQRERLDNTTLIERLVDAEYANPATPPTRGEPPERGDHFGAYPSPETWRKISRLRLKYRMTNTELIAYLVGKV